MPRFHFHFDQGHDEDGFELEDLATAKSEAVKLAGRLISDNADRFWEDPESCLTVTSENGLALFRLRIVGTEAQAIPAGCNLT